MKNLVMALLLAVMAVTLVQASVPGYVTEQRAKLTVSEVRTDARYTGFAHWFGLPKDFFTKHEGVEENLPVGANGKFRWGIAPDDAVPWPDVTPQESAQMVGVTFQTGDGHFLHAQKGIRGNAILFYGKLDKPETIVVQKNTTTVIQGLVGATGKQGDKGDPGETRVIERVIEKQVTLPQPQPPMQPIVVYNITNNFAPQQYGCAQMGGVYGATMNTWQLIGISTTSPTRINVSATATGGAGGSATGGSVGPITNNNLNSNVNSNANNNVINTGSGSAHGSSDATGTGTSTSGR